MEGDSNKPEADRSEAEDEPTTPVTLHWGPSADAQRPQRWGLGVIMIWLSVGVLGLLVSLFVFNIVSRALARPSPEIVAVSAENNEPGLFYTVWVNCTVRNNGGKGRIIISATLEFGGTRALEQVSFFAKGQEKRFRLPFLRVTYLEEGIDAYRFGCDARPRGFRLGKDFY